MEIFDVFNMNGIENYPAADTLFQGHTFPRITDTLFRGFLPQGGGGNAPPLASPRGAYIFQGGGGQCPPRGGGAVKYPASRGRRSPSTVYNNLLTQLNSEYLRTLPTAVIMLSPMYGPLLIVMKSRACSNICFSATSARRTKILTPSCVNPTARWEPSPMF